MARKNTDVMNVVADTQLFVVNIWLESRKERPWPSRQDIDVLDLRPALGRIVLVDVHEPKEPVVALRYYHRRDMRGTHSLVYLPLGDRADRITMVLVAAEIEGGSDVDDGLWRDGMWREPNDLSMRQQLFGYRPWAAAEDRLFPITGEQDRTRDEIDAEWNA